MHVYCKETVEFDSNIFVLLKQVNAYDSFRVVDSLYRSKYFLTPVSGLHQDPKVEPLKNPERIMGDEQLILQLENHKDDVINVHKEMSTSSDEMHRVTILNLPEEVAQPSSEIQSISEIEGSTQARAISPESNQEGETSDLRVCDSNLSRPILPWINGDGTINEIVYKGLVRRILGIVMQNPGILEVTSIFHSYISSPECCKRKLVLIYIFKAFDIGFHDFNLLYLFLFFIIIVTG